MRIALTGATGQVGAALVRRLAKEKDVSIRVLARRDRRALAGQPVEIVSGDVRDMESLVTAFRGCDMVFHLAGLISLSPQADPVLDAVNVAGTANVLDAVRRSGVSRLVHFSSIEALQDSFGVVDESSPLAFDQALSPYGRSKARAEALVRSAADSGLDAVILNPTAVIGPYDFKPSVFGKVLLKVCRLPVVPLVRGGFDWVDSRDVAEAAVRAAYHARPASRYVLSGHWVSVGDLVALAQAAFGKRAVRPVFPLGLAQLARPAFGMLNKYLRGEIASSVTLHLLRSYRHVSHSAAQSDLEYFPRAFEATVRDTINWFQSVGYLRGGGGLDAS